MRMGSDGAGWWVPSAAVRPGANAYCAGAGEDISFDLALCKAGMHVTTFDPTPRSISYVEPLAADEPLLRFVPIGWWDGKAKLRFYAPRNAAHVSHSALNLQGTAAYFEAPVRSPRQLAEELEDEGITIIKMDIEGAESRVIQALVQDGPLPDVLCVEFDQPQALRVTVRAIRSLRKVGYQVIKIEHWNFTFVRSSPWRSVS